MSGVFCGQEVDQVCARVRVCVVCVYVLHGNRAGQVWGGKGGVGGGTKGETKK